MSLNLITHACCCCELIFVCAFNSFTCTSGIQASLEAIERTLTANKRAKASAQFKLIFEDTGSMPDFSSTVPVERSQKAMTNLISPEIVEDDGKSEPINHLIVGGLQSALKPLQRERTADANQARRVILRSAAAVLWDSPGSREDSQKNASVRGVAQALGVAPATVARHVNAARVNVSQGQTFFEGAERAPRSEK